MFIFVCFCRNPFRLEKLAIVEVRYLSNPHSLQLIGRKCFAKVLSKTFHAKCAEAAAVVCGTCGCAAVIVDMQSVDRRQAGSFRLIAQVFLVFGVVCAKPIRWMAFVLVIPKPRNAKWISVQVTAYRVKKCVGAKVNKTSEIHKEIYARTIPHVSLAGLFHSLSEAIHIVWTSGARASPPPHDGSVVRIVLRRASGSIHKYNITCTNDWALFR